MTHTSAHAASAVRYSFFMLRGPGRYTSDRHAGIRKVAKRCAKKREWAAFLREQHNLLLADNFSQWLEEQERLDAEYERECAEYRDAYEDEPEDEHEYRVAIRRNQHFLQRLGEGAIFWDNPEPDTWQMQRVCFDDWDPHCDFCTCCEATINIDRSALHWVINLSIGSASQIELPYMEHSIEQVQQYAQLIYRFTLEAP